MSEPKQVASVLKDLILGEPISSHHGVRCCPAVREDSDDKFIVKIISIPATQSQLDALLFTGACADQAQALAYFKELADGVMGEADILQQLSHMEGFDAYLDCNLQQMPRGIGYQIFLLSKYKPSLAKMIVSQPLTHLAAVNLGLDLCAALSACRKLGYLYVDLRPENIFFSAKKGYRIGDLGFICMSSLPYTSLPEKYRSRYTAPEIKDAMSSLNDTLDIYAAGLILYQVYNNGQLPFENTAPVDPLPSPLYADYEMAEIILKACAPNPKDRWQTPSQMGQALVEYMQRNCINDSPIIPPPIITNEALDDDEDFLSEEENARELEPLLAALPEEAPPQQLSMDGEAQELSTEPIPSEEIVAPENSAPADKDQLSFLETLTNDETASSEETSADLLQTDVTDEVAQMLALADDLIAHELPEPVVAPAAIDVPIPTPPLPEEQPTEDTQDSSEVQPLPPEDGDNAPTEPQTKNTQTEETTVPYDTEDEYLYDLPVRRAPGRWVAVVTTLLLLIAACVGGYIWHQDFFLQSIDSISLQGSGDTLIVYVVSEVDDSLLTVVCTDTYGNTLRSSVREGSAFFTGLNAATQYRIRVEISGLHRLEGNVNAIYTTEDQTEILNFSGICGAEDGSVILNFSFTGPNCEPWKLVISSSDEAERVQSFSGHTVTVTKLTPGVEYTFRLESENGVPIIGQNEWIYTAQKVLYAENLQVTGCGNGEFTVQWEQGDAPAGQLWHLHCFNNAGYDRTVSTMDLSYTFTELDLSTGYTVQVTADGMTQSTSTSISANPVSITGYTSTRNTPWEVTLGWYYTGNAPTAGWLVRMRLNGGEEITFSCPENQLTVAYIPNCIYDLTAEPADAVTFFTKEYRCIVGEPTGFEGYGVAADQLTAATVLRPEAENWSYADLTEESYKNAFTSKEFVSLVLSVDTEPTPSEEEITITFVIRDATGHLISTESTQLVWNTMWVDGHCLLNLPDVPTLPGAYNLDLYFADLYVAGLEFSIV